MRFSQILLLPILLIVCINDCKSQNLHKGYLEQGFEYYFVTQQYDKALVTLQTLQKNYDLKTVKLDYALKLAVKSKQHDLVAALLQELAGDFQENTKATEEGLGEWLKDSTFNFQAFFGKQWGTVSKSLDAPIQRFEDNLKSDYYSMLQSFLSVDQFVRFNDVSLSTFNEVDSINMDNFTNWILEVPSDGHVKSRLNNQILVALLRHLGSKRFALLSEKQVFAHLLKNEIISAQDYGLMYDYLHPKAMYFLEYDAFVEKNWEKSGIKTQSELKTHDERRLKMGLLPLEYSAFCLQKGIEVPSSLRYAKPVDSFLVKQN